MGKGTSVLGASLAVAIAIASFAAPASAKDTRYSGKSSQGQRVVLQTDPQGVASKFVIHFKADCSSSDGFKSRQAFVSPFQEADGDGFRDGGKVNGGSDGVIGKSRTRITGKRVSDSRFVGTFSVKVKYYDHGDLFNTCRAQGVHWAVER